MAGSLEIWVTAARVGGSARVTQMRAAPALNTIYIELLVSLLRCYFSAIAAHSNQTRRIAVEQDGNERRSQQRKKTRRTRSFVVTSRLEALSRSSGEESATRKRSVERHCSRSSSSHNHVRKKGRTGRSPLPIVFSLHPASSDAHGTVTRGARFTPPAASRVP
jgi:hypothetical protein